MQDPRQRLAVRGGGVDWLAVGRERALRDIAAAADLDGGLGRGDGAHRHLVAGERAGLVRADHGRGAERLDRRQLAHDGVGCGHAAHAEAQAYRHDRRQRLRNGGDRERHREQEEAEHDVEAEGRGGEKARGEHHGADAEHDHAQPLAGAVELLLQRRRLRLRRFEEPGDAPHLRVHAGRHHHRAPAPVGRDRAGEQHVVAVADPGIAVDRRGLLRHRHALAGERRLVGPQVRRLDQAGIRRDLVAGLDQHDVAGHDLVRRNPQPLAAADHRGFRRGQRHQRTHGFLGARFLDEAQHRIEDDDRENHDRLVGQRGLARILQQPLDHRDHGRDQEDDDEEILELLQQPLPPGRFRRALEPVGTVLLQAALRFGRGEAERGVGCERGDHRLGRHLVRKRRHGAARRRGVPAVLSRGLDGVCSLLQVHRFCPWFGVDRLVLPGRGVEQARELLGVDEGGGADPDQREPAGNVPVGEAGRVGLVPAQPSGERGRGRRHEQQSTGDRCDECA